MHTIRQTHTRTHILVIRHTRSDTHAHDQMHAHTHTHTHAHATHVIRHTRSDTQAHDQTHAHTHTHTHTRTRHTRDQTHTHTHTHTRSDTHDQTHTIRHIHTHSESFKVVALNVAHTAKHEYVPKYFCHIFQYKYVSVLKSRYIYWRLKKMFSKKLSCELIFNTRTNICR